MTISCSGEQSHYPQLAWVFCLVYSKKRWWPLLVLVHGQARNRWYRLYYFPSHGACWPLCFRILQPCHEETWASSHAGSVRKEIPADQVDWELTVPFNRLGITSFMPNENWTLPGVTMYDQIWLKGVSRMWSHQIRWTHINETMEMLGHDWIWHSSTFFV